MTETRNVANSNRVCPTIARNYTLTEHTMSPEVLIMSLRAWQTLSDADKVIFRKAARESNLYMREQWSALEAQSRRRAQEAGVLIISDFDRKPFEAAMTDIHAKASANPVLSPLIDRNRQVQ